MLSCFYLPFVVCVDHLEAQGTLKNGPGTKLASQDCVFSVHARTRARHTTAAHTVTIKCGEVHQSSRLL